MCRENVLVGVKGFEPPAPCSQSTCATRLRYTPYITARTGDVDYYSQTPVSCQYVFEKTFPFPHKLRAGTEKRLTGCLRGDVQRAKACKAAVLAAIRHGEQADARAHPGVASGGEGIAQGRPVRSR